MSKGVYFYDDDRKVLKIIKFIQLNVACMHELRNEYYSSEMTDTKRKSRDEIYLRRSFIYNGMSKDVHDK